MAPQSIPAPAIPTLNVGGRVFTDLANLKVLYGQATNSSTVKTSFREPSSTSSGYKPGVGKQFRVCAIRMRGEGVAMATTVGFSCSLGYGDNDLGFGSSGSVTNNVAMYGAGNTVCCNDVNNKLGEAPLNFVIPEGKYPYVQVAGGSTAGTYGIYLYGYEEDA